MEFVKFNKMSFPASNFRAGVSHIPVKEGRLIKNIRRLAVGFVNFKLPYEASLRWLGSVSLNQRIFLSLALIAPSPDGKCGNSEL